MTKDNAAITIKWKTGGFGKKFIEPVECVGETAKQLMIREKRWYINGRGYEFVERRHAKMSEYDCYFDTWDEAKAHLMKKAEAELFCARNALQRSQDELGNIKGLKKPEGA